MATLLYGETPNTDVEAGNRADTIDMVAPAPPAPLAAPAPLVSGVPSTVPALPPMRPNYPTPSPWVRREPLALRGLVLGLVAAAVLFSGLTIFGVALAWSYSMTTFARFALMVLGGYLIALGVAYIVSVNPEAPKRAGTLA